MDYLTATIGGLLIGSSAAILLGLNGRIAGISGIFGRLLDKNVGEVGWRLAFVMGLLGAGVMYLMAQPEMITQTTGASPAVLAGAGALVGIGTSMANGCTSGHGVSGIARLSKRSIVATVVFIGTAMVTVFMTHHLGV